MWFRGSVRNAVCDPYATWLRAAGEHGMGELVTAALDRRSRHSGRESNQKRPNASSDGLLMDHSSTSRRGDTCSRSTSRCWPTHRIDQEMNRACTSRS